MYKDHDLRAEVLSKLLGKIVKPHDSDICKTRANILSVIDFHHHHILENIHTHVGYMEEFFIDDKEFFYPQYDCDFTHLSDTAECMRGDEPYERPKGWYRMALNVQSKYPDGDTWLGPKGWRSHSAAGEWPVSYHGTSLDGARGIIKSHYKAGERAAFGRGIYSTPNIDVAESKLYAKIFKSQITGKTYKVILQNRINPERREKCSKSDYWLIPVVAGTSALKEKEIVRGAIRPYGILIKEMKTCY